jgi:hypothetical protein
MGIFSRVEDYISQKSDSNFLIALFGFLYFTSQIIIGSILHPLGTSQVLALQTTMNSDRFKAIASGWIVTHRIEIYLRHFRFDNLHPVWYGIFLSLLIARGFKINNIHPKYNWFILTPFLAAICDLFENMMHLYFLADLQRATPVLVAISGLATNTKWALAFSGVVISSVLIGRWIIRKYIIKKT